MRAEYDFSKGKRGAILPTKGKTRITIYIDNTVLDEFRARAERVGTGYQTMMNDALKAFLSQAEAPVTESVLRRVIREEVADKARPTQRPSGPAQKRRSALPASRRRAV
jgi:BrnA antitoxin of type II toxin-antitoxin system